MSDWEVANAPNALIQAETYTLYNNGVKVLELNVPYKDFVEKMTPRSVAEMVYERLKNALWCKTLVDNLNAKTVDPTI